MLLCLQSACPLVQTPFKGMLGLMILLSDSSSSDSDTLKELDEQVYKESESQASGLSLSLLAPLFIVMTAASSADYLSLDAKIRRLRLSEVVCPDKMLNVKFRTILKYSKNALFIKKGNG